MQTETMVLFVSYQCRILILSLLELSKLYWRSYFLNRTNWKRQLLKIVKLIFDFSTVFCYWKNYTETSFKFIRHTIGQTRRRDEIIVNFTYSAPWLLESKYCHLFVFSHFIRQERLRCDISAKNELPKFEKAECTFARRARLALFFVRLRTRR